MEPVVEHDLAGHRVVMGDQRTALSSKTSWATPPKWRHAPSITRRRGKHVYRHLLAIDEDTLFPEVDLQLMTQWRLETYRRARFGRQHPAMARHRSFDRPQTHGHAKLAPQVLADNVRIAAVAKEALPKPGFMTRQLPDRQRSPTWLPFPEPK
jgi:hypothetical protein